MTTTSAVDRVLQDGVLHVAGADHGDELDAAWGDERRRAAHERDLGAATPRHARHGVSHLARGAVGEVTHGIERLPRRSGAHDHAKILQVLRADQHFGLFGDDVGIGQAPRAGVSACEKTRIGLEDRSSCVAERREVRLHRRVLVHVHVHRRANQNRRARGEGDRRQQVVRHPHGELGDHVRGRGRDDHCVGGIRELGCGRSRIPRSDRRANVPPVARTASAA